MTAFSASRSRLVAFDLTKGALVVCMIIYHALNYSTQRHLGFLFLAFLPPSFILITGFLISHLYRASPAPAGRRRTTRLLTRGIKLLALFTLLNVLAQLLIRERARGQMPGLATFWNEWFDTYVSGDGRVAIFEVLLPIAYLLLLAPILLWIDCWHWASFPVLTVAIMASCALTDAHIGLWANIQMWSAGVFGMLLGRLTNEQLKSFARYWMVPVAGYAFYIAFEVVLKQNWWSNYLFQLLGTGLILAAIYCPFSSVVHEGTILKRLDLLGRYSLVAYIGQIGILQILVRWMERPEPLSVEFLALLLGTLTLTVAGVEFVDWARRKSKGINSFYQGVFA